MTNPNSAVGTNAAYGTRTSVNAFNDIAQLANGRGALSGWSVLPKSGMVLNVGGVAGTRDVAIAEDNLGNRTTVNNRSSEPIEVELAAASASANRYDAIVVYVNSPAQASDTTPDAPDVCGIIDVQGGTTGVSEAQIRAAITADGGTGSIAYYAVLATVYIAAGTTTITSANITANNAHVDMPGVIGIDPTNIISDIGDITSTTDVVVTADGWIVGKAVIFGNNDQALVAIGGYPVGGIPYTGLTNMLQLGVSIPVKKGQTVKFMVGNNGKFEGVNLLGWAL